jgi:hypothetical protein
MHYENCENGKKLDRLEQTPRLVLVFAMGGGSFVEAELMRELGVEMQPTTNVQIIYGCDQVLSPQEFLAHTDYWHTKS